MSLHLAGFGETQDAAGSTVAVAALADVQISTSGDDLTVPELNQVVAMAAGVASGGTGLAQLVAPSLREIGSYVINPINGNGDADAEPDDPPHVIDLRERPITLVESEDIQAEINSDTTSAQFQWVLLWFTDGIRPMPNGPIRTLRFTNGTTLTVDTWTNGALTATENLPRGEYAIVGMQAHSAGLVAARVVPRGRGFRPGCLGGDTDNHTTHEMFRNGGLGEWFRFRHDQIPSVDFLSVSADSDQDVFLDLVKVG